MERPFRSLQKLVQFFIIISFTGCLNIQTHTSPVDVYYQVKNWFSMSFGNLFRSDKLLNYESVFTDWSNNERLIVNGDIITLVGYHRGRVFRRAGDQWIQEEIGPDEKVTRDFCTQRLRYFIDTYENNSPEPDYCSEFKNNYSLAKIPKFPNLTPRLVVEHSELVLVLYREPSPYFADTKAMVFHKQANGDLKTYRELLIPPSSNSCGFRQADMGDGIVVLSGCQELFVYSLSPHIEKQREFQRKKIQQEIIQKEKPRNEVAPNKERNFKCLHPYTNSSPTSRKSEVFPKPLHADTVKNSIQCYGKACPDSSYTNINSDQKTHVIAIYEPRNGNFGANGKYEVAKVRVIVHSSPVPVNLYLSSYEKTIWKIEAEGVVSLGTIYLQSYSSGSIIETTLPYKTTSNIKGFYGHGWESTHNHRGGEFEKMISNVRSLMKSNEYTFQGAYTGEEFHVPYFKSADFAYKREKSAQGSIQMQKIEVPTQEEFSQIFSSFKKCPNSLCVENYVLTENGIRDTTSQVNYSLPAGVPDFSHPMGLAKDTKRNRLVVVTLGGEGFIYEFSLDKKQWSLLSTLNNLDVSGLAYDSARDVFWSLPANMGGGEGDEIVQYSSDLKKHTKIKIKLDLPTESMIGSRPIIAVINDVIVIQLYERMSRGDVPGSRYVVDPVCGEVQVF